MTAARRALRPAQRQRLMLTLADLLEQRAQAFAEGATADVSVPYAPRSTT